MRENESESERGLIGKGWRGCVRLLGLNEVKNVRLNKVVRGASKAERVAGGERLRERKCVSGENLRERERERERGW